MIVAVSTVRNEADIIGQSVAHLLAEGVDQLLIADGMSTDGTREILAGFDQVTIVDDTEEFHRQPMWINRLASRAADLGARWILPFDADEFHCATGGETLAEFFANVRPGITKVYAPMLHHLNTEWRWPEAKPLPKVAYRAFPCSIRPGNHDVSVPGGSLYEGLVVREIQYRGFDHFMRKIRERNATRPPTDPKSHGAHHWQFDGWTREQLEPVWDEMVERATVYDPIPSRVKV